MKKVLFIAALVLPAPSIYATIINVPMDQPTIQTATSNPNSTTARRDALSAAPSGLRDPVKNASNSTRSTA